MMKQRFLPVIGVGLCAMGWTAWAQKQPKPVMLPEIVNYTYWREVTQKPVEMAPRVAAMCASGLPLPNDLSPPTVRGTQGPHAKKYIRVFVNAVGEAAMTTQKEPHFPVGSVIVKQKLPLMKGKGKSQWIGLTPELLTVMVKRAPGYDAAHGDWEYIATDGPGKRMTQSGHSESCQNCHRPFAKTDYVVRSYLPPEVIAALKDTDAVPSAAPNATPVP